MANVYDETFYDDQEAGSLSAARRMLPPVLRLFGVHSMVDVGCGVGTWLKVAKEMGVAVTDGFDGDYVMRDRLHIETSCFHPVDLTKRIDFGRRYDLVLSLEVAEHLPASCAEAFVEDLTNAGPVIMFSAALPGQGGSDHVNERWPDEWRAVFAARGYRALDIVRPVIWGDPAVPFWYQQNTIMFCESQHLAAFPDLRPVPDDVSLNLVHPALYKKAVELGEMYLSKSVKMLPSLVAQAAFRRLRRRM